MQLSGDYRIDAPKQKVWEALNDPDVLKDCIPGCESIEKTSDTSFSAKVKVKVGPVSAKFSGDVRLSDLDPPNGYRISGEGKGGAAGFAKGGANVSLEEDGGGTILHYEVDANVGGKLAQIGSRLIDGTAKKMADDFFRRFAEVVGEAAPAVEEAAPAEAIASAPSPVAGAPAEEELDKDVGAGTSVGIWVVALIIVVLLLLAIFGL